MWRHRGVWDRVRQWSRGMITDEVPFDKSHKDRGVVPTRLTKDRRYLGPCVIQELFFKRLNLTKTPSCSE